MFNHLIALLLALGVLMMPLAAADSAHNTNCPVCAKAVDTTVPVINFKPNVGPKSGDAAPTAIGFCSQGCHTTFAADPEVQNSKATAACCANHACVVCGEKPVDGAVPAVSFKSTKGPKSDTSAPVLIGFCSMKCHEAYAADPAAYSDKAENAWQKSRNTKAK